MNNLYHDVGVGLRQKRKVRKRSQIKRDWDIWEKYQKGNIYEISSDMKTLSEIVPCHNGE